MAKDAIPAGSDSAVKTEQKTENTPKIGEGTEAPKEKILGKFDSTDDLVKSYQELEKKYGQQANDMGLLRKQVDFLSQQQGQASSKKSEDMPPKDYGAEMAALMEKVEEGEIGLAEALQRQADLTQERTLVRATEAFQKFTAERDSQKAVEQFISQNPDFPEVQKAGILDSIKRSNPLHDDFSAYQEMKSRQALEAAKEETRIAYEKGRQEAARLASGQEPAKKVVAKPGTGMQAAAETPPKRDGGNTDEAVNLLRQLRTPT